MDIAYTERANGHWEVWIYTDGQRVTLWPFDTLANVERWAFGRGYRLVTVT